MREAFERSLRTCAVKVRWDRKGAANGIMPWEVALILDLLGRLKTGPLGVGMTL